MQLRHEDWGLVAYAEALKRQLSLRDKVFSTGELGILVFCSHPPVVTLGSKAIEDDLDGWAGDIVQVSRGGRATYHGPSQLVIYPIINLNHLGLVRQKDLGWYLDVLESSVVEALQSFGLAAEGRSHLRFTSQKQSRGRGQDLGLGSASSSAPSETGVWLKHQEQDRKIASLGIGIKDWVTYHGVALNCSYDPQAFQGLRPCGFAPEVMISMEEAMGHSSFQENMATARYGEALRSEFQNRFLRIFSGKLFNRDQIVGVSAGD